MLKKTFKFFLFSVFPLIIISVLAVSYFAMRKLVFPFDRKIKGGKLQSVVALQIRGSVLQRKDSSVVYFKTRDGIKLSGILVKRNKARANLLVCHGYQSCKELVADYIDMFPKFNILLFDFRAHGQSGGRLRTLGCHEYKDVIAAAQFLKSNTKINRSLPNSLPLIILGCSMGGSVALYALQDECNLCDVLIMDSSYSRLNDVIYNAFTIKSGGLPTFPFVPVIKKMVNFIASCDVGRVCPIDTLKKIKEPVLFIHSCVDKIVSPSDSLLMYADCENKKKKLWIGPKCRHSGLHKKFYSQYKKKVDKFLKKTLSI